MHRARTAAGLGLATVLFLSSACSAGDDGSDEKEPSATSSEGALSGPLVELSGAGICAALSPDQVATALGVTVTGTASTEDPTPQCSYSYGSADGTTYTNLSVLSTTEVGAGADLAEAFDFVLEGNRTVGGKGEETEVDAGDRAVLLDRDEIDVAVLAVGGHVLTITVSDDGAISGEQIADLLRVLAESLGG